MATRVFLSIDPQKYAWPQKYNQAQSTQNGVLGEKIRTLNAIFQYVEFDGEVDGSAGMICYWVDKNPLGGLVSCDVSVCGGAAAKPAGFLVCAMTDSKFGWILKEGPISLIGDVKNTVAEANATADCPVNSSPAIGDIVIPAAVTDGYLAYLLQEEGDEDDQDVASLEASIIKMQQNLTRTVGTMTNVTASSQSIMARIKDW